MATLCDAGHAGRRRQRLPGLHRAGIVPAQLVRPPPRPGDEPGVLRRRRRLGHPAALAAEHDRTRRLAQRMPGTRHRGAGAAAAAQSPGATAAGGHRPRSPTATARRMWPSRRGRPRTSWTRPGSRWTGRSRRAMRTSRFWWIAVGYFCALFAWYAVQVHQTKYLVEIGFITGARCLGAGRREPRRHSGPDRTRPSVGSHRAGIRVGGRHAWASRWPSCCCCCCATLRHCRCCT